VIAGLCEMLVPMGICNEDCGAHRPARTSPCCAAELVTARSSLPCQIDHSLPVL
jgi:hypothetical protein